MATPRFSFSGWTTSSISPKVPVQTPGLMPPGGTPIAPPATIPLPVAQTSAANNNLPEWLQTEVANLNAQQALRNQFQNQVTQQAPINYGGILAGSAALTRAQTGQSLYMDQRGLNNQIQELMRQRASMYQGGGAPGLYDLSGAGAMDRRLQYLTGVAAPLGASTLSSFGTGRSGWASPQGGSISAGFF